MSDHARDTNILSHKLAWIKHLFSLLIPNRVKKTLIDRALDPRDSVCFSFQSAKMFQNIWDSHRKIQYVSSHTQFVFHWGWIIILSTKWLSGLCEKMTGWQMELIFACLKSHLYIQDRTQVHIWCKITAKTNSSQLCYYLQLLSEKGNAQS